jgi:hypothetical protein
VLHFSVLVIEDLRRQETTTGTPGRWGFGHRLGNAWVESPKYPEAAVAYEREFVENACRGAGFERVEHLPLDGHTIVRAWKRGPA